MATHINGFAVAGIAGGSILMYAGVTGKSVLQVFAELVTGRTPANLAQQYPIQGTSNPGSGGSGSGSSVGGNINGPAKNGDASKAAIASYKAFAQGLVVQHGWSGQFGDLDWVIMHESGYNPLATNPSSKAFGIAQALGHGTSSTVGTLSNEYGNFGTSDSVCKAANSGNGYAQLIWMCNYIASRYGSPAKTRAQYNQGY